MHLSGAFKSYQNMQSYIRLQNISGIKNVENGIFEKIIISDANLRQAVCCLIFAFFQKLPLKMQAKMTTCAVFSAVWGLPLGQM